MRKILLNNVMGLALFAGAVACSDAIVAPSSNEPAYAPGLASRLNVSEIVALARNVYIGANADAVIVALADGDAANDIPALLTAIATLQATDFPARARALAQEIARSRPHFVGLQEVSDIDIQIPPLGVALTLDFLAILEAELQSLGLDYDVAGKVANASVLLAPIPGSTIQVIDYDVLLVDSRRVTFNPASVVAQNFSSNIGVVAPGINVIRGWVSITAEVDGQTFTVATTHLESGNSNPVLPFLRAAQAFELVSSLGAASPAIIMGDLNDVAGSPMYQVVTGAGFKDAWLEAGAHGDGFTCCFLPDLSNAKVLGALTQRIDYVFARGAVEDAMQPLSSTKLLGDGMEDRLRGPAGKIWPSDHAGVVAVIPFPK